MNKILQQTPLDIRASAKNHSQPRWRDAARKAVSRYYFQKGLQNFKNGILYSHKNTKLNCGFNFHDVGFVGRLGGEFDPLSISGCKLWLKADVGVTKDGGNLVSNWADQSGNSNDVAQATGTNQPLWVDAAHASKPTIRFDGVDNFLDLAAFASGDLTQPNFIFIVSTFPSSSPKYVYDSSDGTKRNAFLRNATGYQIFASTGIAVGSVVTTLQQFTAKYNSTTSYLRKDGTQIVSGDVGTLAMNGMVLGSTFNASGNFGNVDICEILVYNASLSDTDRDAIENYLAIKWGL